MEKVQKNLIYLLHHLKNSIIDMKYMINKIINWLSWPLIYLVVNNSERTRVLIIEDKKLLVVQGWINDGKWQLPGGGKKSNESFVNAAIRELHEETNLKVEAHELEESDVVPISENKIKYICHFFILKNTNLVDIKPQHEIRKIKWIDFDSINKNNFSKDILAGIKLVNR